MPKAPLKAQIIIGLFAVLAIVYGFSIARVDQSSGRHQITVVPGQLIAVRTDSVSMSMASSDPWVVAPLMTSSARAYFLALKPGRAILSAQSSPECLECGRQPLVPWTLEVTVWPSG